MNRKIIVYDYYKASKKRIIEKQEIPETTSPPKAEKPETTFSRNLLLKKAERGPVTHFKKDNQHLAKPERHDSFELILRSLISSEELTRSYEDVLQETKSEIAKPQQTDSPRAENVEAGTASRVPPTDDLLTEDIFAKLLSPNPSSNGIIIQRTATQDFSIPDRLPKPNVVPPENITTAQQVKEMNDSAYDQEVRQLQTNTHAKTVDQVRFPDEDKKVDSMRKRVSSDDLFGNVDSHPLEMTSYNITHVKAVPETDLIDISAGQDETVERVAGQTLQNFVKSSFKFDDSLDKLLLEDLLTSSSKSSENDKRNEVLGLANTNSKLPNNSESVSQNSESFLLNLLTGSFSTSENDKKLENVSEDTPTQCSLADIQPKQDLDVVNNVSFLKCSQKRIPILENSDSFKFSLRDPSLSSDKLKKSTAPNKTVAMTSKTDIKYGHKHLDQKVGKGSRELNDSVGKSLSSITKKDGNLQKNFKRNEAHSCLIENKSMRYSANVEKLNKPKSITNIESASKSYDNVSRNSKNFGNDPYATSAEVTKIDTSKSKDSPTTHMFDQDCPKQSIQLDRKKVQCFSLRNNPQQFVLEQPASNNSKLTRSSASSESNKKVGNPKLTNEDMSALKPSKNWKPVNQGIDKHMNVLKPLTNVSKPGKNDKSGTSSRNSEVQEIDLIDLLNINNKPGESVEKFDRKNVEKRPEPTNSKDESSGSASVASVSLNKSANNNNAHVKPLKCVSAEDSDSTISDLEIPDTDNTTIKRPYDVALLLGFDQNDTETENKSGQYSALLTSMDASNKMESNVESLSKDTKRPSEPSSNVFDEDLFFYSEIDNSITLDTEKSAESKIDPVSEDQVSSVSNKKSVDVSQIPALNREPIGSQDKKPSKHILQCLSNKATRGVGEFRQSSVDSMGFPSENTDAGSKIAVHNINQIATESWLRTATKETSLKNKQRMVKKIRPMADTESKENIKPKVKRYSKGRTKIYRTKFAKKKTAPVDEDNFSVDGIIEHLTQTCSNNEKNTKCNESLSTRSVPSSYVTDETRSNVSNRSTIYKDLPEPERKLNLGLCRIFRDESLKCADMSLLFGTDKEQIKMKIQEVFYQVFEALEDGRTPCLKVRKKTFENCVFEDDRLQMKPSIEAEMKSVSYGNTQSHFRFCLILHVLAKIHTLIENETKLTKREMFYQIKHIIKSQDQINDAIEDISCFLNVGPWELNIISHRGLIYGSLKITYASKEVLNCNVPGVMIPYDVDDIVELMSEAYFILVVEKEAIFHKLLEEDLPNKLSRPFIMITGKGFPDLNTQLFLKKLWTLMSIPVFILVDADPHGIQIMITYRFGSLNSSHLSKHLAIPNARWLGVFPSEISKFGINSSPMIPKESKMVQSLLETPYVRTHPRLVEELEVLLSKNRKASIEGLIKSNNFLSTLYLPTKFFSRDYI